MRTRWLHSPATPSTAEEPATDAAGDDDADTDASKDVSEGERELVTMLRKVDKKSRRNQARYEAEGIALNPRRQ
jgi:hypothetical protein